MEYSGKNDFRDYYLSHHGILGQKWGIRRFQAYGSGGYERNGGKTGKVVKLQSKISKNNAKLDKLNNYRNAQRNRKLELKKTKLESKRAKLTKRVNKAKVKKELHASDPNWFERKAIRKSYKLDAKISRLIRKQNAWKIKVSNLEYQNAKLENKIDKYLEAIR